jgi:hypothetical protein
MSQLLAWASRLGGWTWTALRWLGWLALEVSIVLLAHSIYMYLFPPEC